MTLALDAIDHDAASGTLSFDVAGTRWMLTRGGVRQRAGRDPADADGAPSPDGRYRAIARDFNLFAQATAHAILLTGVGRERDRSPYASALYRVTLDGRQPVLLTPEPMNHDVRVSPDGRWFIDAMSSATDPTLTVVRSAAARRIVATLGRADAAAPFATGFTAPEPFRGVAADGHTPLHGMIFRPTGFDPRRSYPVIDDVYTGRRPPTSPRAGRRRSPPQGATSMS